MRIKHIRLVLPPRMRGTALSDARTLANAAVRALENGQITGGTVDIQGGGRPATLVARDIGRAANAIALMPRRKV